MIKQVVTFDDGQQITLVPKEPDPYPVWIRLPHDTERVNFDNRDFRYIPNTGLSKEGVIRQVVRERHVALPEVYRFLPFHNVLLTKPLQLLWKGIMPEISGTKWRSLLGSALMFTNNSSGFGGGTCHADYVNGLNLDCPPPGFDQSRFTGGAIVKAKLVGDYYYIKTIVTTKPLPTAKELLADTSLWFWAMSIAPTGRIQYITRLGTDGTYKRIRIPLFTEKEVYLPKDEVHVLGTYQKIESNTIVYS